MEKKIETKKKRKKWTIQSWNIDTLEQGDFLDKKGEIKLKKGEMDKIFEITKELRIRDIDMLFLQETRRKEQNSVINGYRIIMSGANKGKKGLWRGTGVILKDEIYKNCVLAVEQITHNIQNIYFMLTEDKVLKFINVYKTLDDNKEQWDLIEREWREKSNKKTRMRNCRRL